MGNRRLSDQDAEQSVLGALFILGTIPPEIRDSLAPGDFSSTPMKHVFGAMLRVANREEPIDFITVKSEMGDLLQSHGGPEFLVSLAESVPTPMHATTHEPAHGI
jgi:replicative DNA helicase